MLGGIALLLIGTIGSIFSKEKSLNKTIYNLTSLFWLVSLLLTIKFLPFRLLGLSIALLFTTVSLILMVKSKENNWVKQPFFYTLLVGLTFYLLPTDVRYNLVSIQFSSEKEYDYRSWDKYSWFLYNNGHYNEAQNATEKALKMAKLQEDEYYIEFIEKHGQLIRNKSWKSFRE